MRTDLKISILRGEVVDPRSIGTSTPLVASITIDHRYVPGPVEIVFHPNGFGEISGDVDASVCSSMDLVVELRDRTGSWVKLNARIAAFGLKRSWKSKTILFEVLSSTLVGIDPGLRNILAGAVRNP